MKRIEYEDWLAMSGRCKTIWLEDNFPVNGRGGQRKAVHGVGVNDATYRTSPAIDGGRVWCPAYITWKDMINRAFSEKYHAKHKTYTGVTVCHDWLKFSNFRKWWIDNHVEGWQVDKDVLTDNRVYSPDTCLLIPSWLNKFITNSSSIRGEFPIGVSFHKLTGMFVAQCGNPASGKREHIGLFKTPEEAHMEWVKRKLSIAMERKGDMDKIDERIYDRVVAMILSSK